MKKTKQTHRYRETAVVTRREGGVCGRIKWAKRVNWYGDGQMETKLLMVRTLQCIQKSTYNVINQRYLKF